MLSEQGRAKLEKCPRHGLEATVDGACPYCRKPYPELTTPALPDSDHPEKTCQSCGGPNVTWFASNEVWNKAHGGPDGILCPVCFVVEAEKAGFDKAAWKLVYDEPRALPDEVRRAAAWVADKESQLGTTTNPFESRHESAAFHHCRTLLRHIKAVALGREAVRAAVTSAVHRHLHKALNNYLTQNETADLIGKTVADALLGEPTNG